MDSINTVLPQFFPAAWLDQAPELVYSDFPSRIRVGYVIREDGAYSYLLKDEFLTSGLSIDALYLLALKNLQELPSGQMTIADVPGGAEGYISSDDNFSAVRLLLPEVRLAFASSLGDEFLAVIPHRDECFCWSKAQESSRQLRHAREAMEDFVEDDYNLTPDIFLVSARTIHLFGEPESAEIRVR